MFDIPVFKILAHNDTGQAAGHQGGMVIPGELEEYFPDVVGSISPSNPTIDVEISATLILGNIVVGNVSTRYQYQTWGGTRSPERRLTSNLGPLRNPAQAGDIALFQRDLTNSRVMRITLVRHTDPEYSSIMDRTGGKRWGLLKSQESPVANHELEAARLQIETIENSTFTLFESSRGTIKTISARKARTAAFRKRLLAAYRATCSVSGITILTPTGLNNLDAAHIVPVEFGGTDDPRNGILLSKDLHWAFDRGLFTLNKDYTITVGHLVSRIPENSYLENFHGKTLQLPKDSKFAPHPKALEWHQKNIAIM